VKALVAFLAMTVVSSVGAATAFAQTSSSTASAGSGSTSSSSTTDSRNCRVVHLKKGESPPGGSSGMSTSITAGNGKVSGTTTGPGGTVHHSGSGSFSTSSSSDGKNTIVTDSSGNCTVYRKAED
jgi:hypothetical protein